MRLIRQAILSSWCLSSMQFTDAFVHFYSTPLLYPGDLFQYAVKLWIEDHDLTDRIHIEWSSSMTTLGMVVESNGSCTCSTSYRESEDAEPCSSDPIQAGPTGKRLTLMLSRRLKPRKEMLASLLDVSHFFIFICLGYTSKCTLLVCIHYIIVKY